MRTAFHTLRSVFRVKRFSDSQAILNGYDSQIELKNMKQSPSSRPKVSQRRTEVERSERNGWLHGTIALRAVGAAISRPPKIVA